MTFRPRKGNYITQRRGRYYYRRMIPVQFQNLFTKKVWMIALEGQNDTDRATEAQGIADRHNRQMRMVQMVDVGEATKLAADAVVMRIDLSPNDLPPGAPAPVPARFYRDGRNVETTKYAVTDDPAQRRAAEGEGFFVVSQEQARAQIRPFDEAFPHLLQLEPPLPDELGMKVTNDRTGFAWSGVLQWQRIRSTE